MVWVVAQPVFVCGREWEACGEVTMGCVFLWKVQGDGLHNGHEVNHFMAHVAVYYGYVIRL